MGKWILGIATLAVLLTAGWAFAQPAPPPEQPAIVVAEGEQFKPLDNKGWKLTHQDDSYASHTYGGMWTMNGALLGAPADSDGSVAVQDVTIPAAGQYRVWSKYQSPPYFSFTHKLEVVQGGKTVLSRVYGKIDAPRLFSFGAAYNYKPLAQLWWFWGVDHDAAEGSEPVTLVAGPAQIRLVTVKGPQPAGDPMVDFVVLTTDLRDGYLGGYPGYNTSSPFTREAFAASKLYMRFQNTTGAPAKMTLRVAGHYQPDYGGKQAAFPEEPVAPGAWSPWFNVAPTMKLVHEEGAWLSIPGATEFPVQAARDAAGKEIVGDCKVPNGESVVIPIDIAWNKTRRVRTSRECAQELINLSQTTWRTANGGKKPKEILYFGAFNGPAWVGDLKDALGYNTGFDKWPGKQYDHNPIDGYHQHTHNDAEIRQYVPSIKDKAAFRVLSFGDEIHIPEINYNDPALQPLFTQWVKAKGLTKADLGVEPDRALLTDRGTNARLKWYSKLFSDEQGFAQFQNMTKLAKELIGPQVETGANYSPHVTPQYYGPQNQYVDIFKANGMTMYWTEDYIFSVAQQPQMISWMFGIQNCAVKYNKQKIHMYIMPHAPGQVPEFFRRSLVYAVGAGARHIDNFWVAPAETFTENSIAWAYPDMFKVLHESIYDSAEVEPYQLTGKERPNRVAIIIGRATDFNERLAEPDYTKDKFLKMCDNAKGQGPKQNICHVDQQMLFFALKHAQLGVDLITEEDILDGYLKNYDTVYFSGEWVNHQIIPVLERWAANGGILYAAGGLGHKNEFNEQDPGMPKLLGLKGVTVDKNLYHVRPYLELPLADPIDTITLDGAKIPAIGMKQVLQPDTAKVLGTWADGTAAVTVRTVGKGKIFAVGTLAGCTYMKTGLRVTPWARGGRKMVYNPTGFDAAATKLALLGVDAKPLNREVVCSNQYVEALVRDSDQGTLLTLVNWDNTPLPGLTVSVKMPAAPKSIRSVQDQKNVTGAKYENGTLTFTTDLEWANYYLLAK
ncbi:MAG: beta-galactosidase trimerization domain-containing protein [Armatimonadota bacterium]